MDEDWMEEEVEAELTRYDATKKAPSPERFTIFSAIVEAMTENRQKKPRHEGLLSRLRPSKKPEAAPAIEPEFQNATIDSEFQNHTIEPECQNEPEPGLKASDNDGMQDALENECPSQTVEETLHQFVHKPEDEVVMAGHKTSSKEFFEKLDAIWQEGPKVKEVIPARDHEPRIANRTGDETETL